MLTKSASIALFITILFSTSARADNGQQAQWANRFYTEVMNAANYDLLDTLVDDGFQEHEPLPGFQPNKEGLKQFFMMMRKAFPDLKSNVEFMVIDDDKIVSYVTMTGTHQGEYFGVKGTGKTFKINVIDIIEVVDGKMTAHWGVGDYLTMMAQLGINAQ